MPIEDFIIIVYCFVDSELKKLLNGRRIRTRGFDPKLTDAEVITMEIVGEFLGFDAEKHIWQYFRQHWQEMFPGLGSRSNFAKQCANLWYCKQEIQQSIACQIYALADDTHMVDGLPMPVCKYARANRCRIFEEEADFGHCASKDEKYYGFHGHLVINFNGVITGFTVTAANADEREAMFEITENIIGLLIGDKGYISFDKQQAMLEERQINLQTPLRDNMKDDRDPKFVKKIMSIRRKVETVIGQLVEQFNIAKIRARDKWHLTSRLARKLLSHTMGLFVNKLLGRDILQLEGLIMA